MNTAEDNLEKDPWLKKLDVSKQFILPENSETATFLQSNYPRAIVVNKTGIVKSGFTNINSNSIFELLNNLN